MWCPSILPPSARPLSETGSFLYSTMTACRLKTAKSRACVRSASARLAAGPNRRDPLNATDIESVVAETVAARSSERQGRLIDHDEAGAMERKKQEGYF